MTVWRKPAAKTTDYPGLVVHDGRVSGSITAGDTRLPLWCFTTTAITEGWDEAEGGWKPSQYGMTAETFAMFLYYLMEQRGEFGRLLCVLADAERREASHRVTPWWEIATQRKRVLDALKCCMAALEDGG